MSLIQHNIDLKPLTTLGASSNAYGLACVASVSELTDVLDQYQQVRWKNRPRFILGGGSNVVFVGNYPGLIIHPLWSNITPLEETEEHMVIRVGAGHNWHQLVQWHLREGLSGLENLALIPGDCGAAPIQNIGAYGVEFSTVCVSVGIYDLDTGNTRDISAAKCKFGYRHSIFKTSMADNWLITDIVLKLNKQLKPVLSYPGLQYQLEQSGLPSPTAVDIASAIIAIRQQKLPDPAVTGNVGSFFKNPIVASEHVEKLLKHYPKMPHWSAEHGIKLSAAWLIEQCGWKGRDTGDAGVYPDHALILINTGNSTGKDILTLATDIQMDVRQQFEISLQTEPQIITG